MASKRCQFIASAALFVATLLAAGCSDNGGRVQVVGRVQLNGKPLTQGLIVFFPAESNIGLRPCSSNIGADGRYRLGSLKPEDGIKPGKYLVSFDVWGVEERGQMNWDKKALPEKYFFCDKSGLSAEVTDQPLQEFNFELTTK